MARDISIRLSVEDADRVKAVLQSVGATGEQAFSAFERGATAGAQSFTKLERSLDPLVASQARFAAAQAGINRALESGLTTQERATQLLDLAKRRYVDLDDAAGKVSTGTAKLGTVIGQAGFQIQDFAVQVAGGQNAMTALAQQGSQLLGVFGNFGAVAGAALAIGAIAAQMIYGKSAAEQFTATIEAQNSAYDDALRQADRMQDALKRQQDQYRSAAEAGQRYRDGLRGEGEALVRLTDYYARLTEAERQAETARIRATADQRRAAAQYALDQASNRISGRVAVVEGNVAAPEADPLSLIGPNGPAALPTQLQSAVAAFQQFRDAGNLTTEALSRYIAEVRRAIEAGGDHSRELAELERSLIEVLPIINQLEEANRRLAVQQRALSNTDPQTVALERGRSAAEQLGGAYQQRQQLQRQMRDLRAALPLASSREEASAFRSSMQAGAAALEGLTPATTQMLRGLRDQATLAHVAAGAARELAASDIALDNAARQAGAGQASLAEKTEGRRLVQLRLDGQLMDALETLNRQINGTDRLAEAQQRGGAAAREAEARTRAETEALKYRAETDERYANIVQVLTTRYVALGEAQARARSAQTEYNQQQQLELLRAEQSLVAGNVALRERELAVLRERQRLDQEGVVDEAARARRLANAARIADETQALRRQQEAWNDLANLGSQAFDRIGNAITQAFANGEMRTIRFGNIAKAVAAEVAQYFAKIALVNPILNAVFGTSRPTISDLGGIVGSLFGGSRSSGAGSIMIDGVPLAAYQPLGDGVSGPVLSLPAGVAYSVLGGSGIGGFGSGAAAGGGMGLMQMLGLAGSGGSLMNNMGGGSMLGGIGRWLGLTGEGGLFNSIGNGISNFLATPLWTYGNLPNATNAALANMGGLYGPATPAQVAAEGAGVATLGQVAGGVLGLAGGAYGIYSGIQKGGIGGAFQVAGGAVGMAAGASSLLAAAGVIGASMGPVGWIAAAVLAVVGALLPGQKASNREGNATFDFVEDSLSISGQTGKKYSQANRDSASNLLKGVVDITERFEKTLGLRFDQKVTVGVGDRDGIYYSVNDAGAVTMGRYGRSDQGAKDLARDLLGTLVRQSAADLPDAALRNPLTNMKWTSLEEGLQLIQQLVEVTNNARPSASQNIAAANIDWSDFANGLADLKWVKETYDVMVQGTSPAEKFARELQQLNDSFDAAVEKARDLGLSEEALNQARAKQVQAAYDKRELEGLQLVARQQNTLTSFLDNLTYADATPAEKLRLAQEGFGNVLATARSADLRTANLASVTQAAGTLIEAGRNYYATGPGAAELERFVRSSIESLGAQLQLPAFGGDLALSLEAAVNPLKDELELLRDEVTALREELRTSRLRTAA